MDNGLKITPETPKRKNNRGAPERVAKYKWKPGQSGNPKGRPKGPSLGDEYRKLLQQKCPIDKKGRTWGQVGAERIFAEMVKGEVAAAKEIEDRVAGKAVQALEVSGPDQGAIEVDLSAVPTEQLRAIMDAVRGKKT